MLILAFETSCDDTSVALFEDSNLIAMDTASQIKIHESTWWVVPEVAAREHANNIFNVLDNVLKSAKWKMENKKLDSCNELSSWTKGEGSLNQGNISNQSLRASSFHSEWQNNSFLSSIDYIAVTVTPGLIPSLLTWITVARTISKSLNIPLIEINHIEAQII